MRSQTTRRELLLAAAATALAGNVRGQQAVATMTHEMYGLKFTMPEKPEKIAMVIYPGMTALDLVGPQQVFGFAMAEVHLVWKNRTPVVSDTGLSVAPTKTFAECPDPVDIVFIGGGGTGTTALMEDAEVLAFLKSRAQNARYVTSVCSGSLVLGAAGLLQGYKATSHWAVRDVLPLFGAEPVEARFVQDRNRITAGGVTSGIDFGLRLAALLRGEDYARALELMLEYDPQPPYGGGTPRKAGERIATAMTTMYKPANDAARAAARRRKA